MRTEVDAMERFLDRLSPGRAIRPFAYPCDASNLGRGSANAQAHRFAQLLRDAGISAARTSEGPPNSPLWVDRRRYRLAGLAMGYDALNLDAVRDYLVAAERSGAWAILVFHDIVEGEASAGATTASDHAAILRMIRASGAWCAPLGEVLAYIDAADMSAG
jgi:hypothetical protein